MAANHGFTSFQNPYPIRQSRLERSKNTRRAHMTALVMEELAFREPIATDQQALHFCAWRVPSLRTHLVAVVRGSLMGDWKFALADLPLTRCTAALTVTEVVNSHFFVM